MMDATTEKPHRAAPPWALVLAGGDGTRLQELTRLVAGAPIPKQYCRLYNGQSLLEATLSRIDPLASPERTLVIATRHHRDLAREQLGTVPLENLLVQPSNRDTGPGILFPLLELARRDSGATVMMFPSDHYVGNPPAFRAHVAQATQFVNAHPDRVALLGIRPERADAGFGYIEPGAPVSVSAADTYQVARFREKPSAAAAVDIIRRGGLWNSFVVVFSVARMLELIATIRPAESAALRRLMESDRVEYSYHQLEHWNFSRDVLARIPEHLVVVKADHTGWSDWGTREAIERTFAELSVVPPWLINTARARRVASLAA